MPTKKNSRYELAPGPDVDLEREDIRDRKGDRITAEYAERAVDEVHAKLGRGRPSLTEPGRHSPHISFRVSEETRARAEELALSRGVSVSGVSQIAISSAETGTVPRRRSR